MKEQVMDEIAATEQQEEAQRRRDYVQGLRELAAFVESNPDIPLPYAGAHNAFVRDKAELAIVARACGGKWAKNATEDFFYISKPFAGEHRYDVNVSRETVCTKVVVGKRTVEAVPEHEVEDYRWECSEPLLTA